MESKVLKQDIILNNRMVKLMLYIERSVKKTKTQIIKLSKSIQERRKFMDP
jgi:hypothetical protein